VTPPPARVAAGASTTKPVRRGPLYLNGYPGAVSQGSFVPGVPVASGGPGYRAGVVG